MEMRPTGYPGLMHTHAKAGWLLWVSLSFEKFKTDRLGLVLRFVRDHEVGKELEKTGA